MRKMYIKTDERHNFVTEGLYEDLGLIDGYFVSWFVINDKEYFSKVCGTEMKNAKESRIPGLINGARLRGDRDNSFAKSAGFEIIDVEGV